MHLYSLSTHKSYTQTCLISNLLVSASSSTITLSTVNEDFARLQILHTENTFASITKLIPISDKSFCVLSDSGGIAIMKYENGKLSSTIANFMRSGIRTVTPVYGACDPQGRVLLVSGIESERLTFVLGMEGEINGPVDSSLKNCIVYDLCVVDVGYMNPVFCQIERKRGESKCITFYEFDLGLNILKRNQSIPCNDAHLLIPLPEHLHGVLVCRRNRIEYYSHVSTRAVILIAFPGRALCGTVHQVKQDTFAMIQAEDGRIYKLNFVEDPELDPKLTMNLQYFAPADPATALHIFKAGFLYTAAEITDHKLYQFLSLGDEEPIISYGCADDEKCELLQIQEEPENLEETDVLLNFNALTCSRLGSARTKLQQSMLIGSGKTLREIKYGLEIEELVSSALPEKPIDIFVTGVPSKYIIVCFKDDVLVLEVGESVSEVKDSGLVKGKTLWAQEMAGVLVQIHSKGIRQKGQSKIKDWTAASPIIAATANEYQVLIALEDKTFMYYEMVDGALEMKISTTLKAETSSIAFPEVPKGLKRSDYVAIGSKDMVYVCAITDELELIGAQTLSAPCSSICIDKQMMMHIGLENGIYIQTQLDSTKKAVVISKKSRLLGASPVKISNAWCGDNDVPCMIAACKGAAWAVFPSHTFDMVPLNVNFTSVARFTTEDSPQSLAGIIEGDLKLFSIENTKTRYQTSNTELSAIPRRITRVQGTIYTLMPHSIHFNQQEQLLPDSLTAIAFSGCRFECRKQDFLVVSALRNMHYEGFEQKYDEALILVYQLGDKLDLVHITLIPEAANALIGFNGMLLAGLGSKLILYDMGIKQLLKKKTESIGTKIIGLSVNRNRVFVGDSRRSVSVLAFSGDDFIFVADDPIARPVSVMTVLDFDTVAIGDRFGNFSVLRIPKTAAELSADATKLPLLAAKPAYLNGAHFKLDLIANYYIGDVITGMQLGIFAPGALESLAWCGVQGNMGALIPMNESDVKFFFNLEAEMRKTPGILGRSHLAYRGYIAPPKNVIDGELCELYGSLPKDTKQEIAEKLATNPDNIETRVAEFRVRYIRMQ